MAGPPFSGKGETAEEFLTRSGVLNSGTAQKMRRTVTKRGALSCVVGFTSCLFLKELHHKRVFRQGLSFVVFLFVLR